MKKQEPYICPRLVSAVPTVPEKRRIEMQLAFDARRDAIKPLHLERKYLKKVGGWHPAWRN